MATTTTPVTQSRPILDRTAARAAPTSTVARLMNGIIEGCWLLAVIAAPLYFNVNSRRVFEPDKITVVRNLVIVMIIAVIVKAIAAAPRLVGAGAAAAGTSRAPGAIVRRLWRTYPLIIPVGVFVLVYLAATVTSINPSISFWGSYERLQGTYTWLTYIALFLIMVMHIYRWRQIERIVTAAIFTTIPVSLYGVLQHFGQNLGLAWGGDVFTRVASTMGNAIFLGAYLLMVVPLTIYRIVLQVRELVAAPPPQPAPQARPGRRSAVSTQVPAWKRRREQRNGIIMLVVYAVALLLQLFAILYTYSRGPFGGLVVALLSFGVIAGLRYRLRWLVGACLGLFALGLLILGLANMKHPLIHSSGAGISRLVAVTSSESGTTEVRQLIWQGSRILIKERPLLGWGPETMLLAYNPVYPPQLGHIESANASPDRNHDEEMDFLVMSGVLGLLAYLAIVVTFFWIASRLVTRLRGLRETLLAIALISIVIGHIGEGLTGIAIVSTLVMMWTCFALASVIYRMTLSAPPVPAAAVAMPAAAPVTPAEARPGRRPAPSRGGAGTPPRPAAPASGWERLSGGPMIGALGIAGVGIVAVVALLALFVANYRVVSADVSFKDALNYEAAALQYYNQGHGLLATAQTGGAAQTVQSGTTPQQQATQNYNVAFQYFRAATDLFNQAIDQQPSQDFYYLYLGKTLLEKVQADRDVNNTAGRDQDVQQAERILLRAHQLNPLDTDHSANLGRMYTMWAAWDPSKWPLGMRWFAEAVRLSPHHSRLFDEYGLATRNYGQYLISSNNKSLGMAMYRRATRLFRHAAFIDPQLSDAFALWGDTQFVPIFLNNPTAAIQPYEQALKLIGPTAPNATAIETNLSIGYLDEKKYAKARGYASQVLATLGPQIKATAPTQPTYQQLLGTYNQALAVYNRASAALKNPARKK